ncbi:AEC family transporter [Bosea sp. (in: a-proteobacteria)]|uniref:AEC family transporter n=1 Tax=Bosea sp. (in: a-proteobacteria) TaxID=1871050 RepID=UPI00261CA58F|nr:AEC family transporter [Bosea sp. (in: a-proteobacteria)]MCO5093274.1 AEC family transporter [Bosea sp. (in: a-proteobacteria)]
MADLLSIFNLVAPFFGLILLGFAIGRVKRLPEAGLAWLQFFLIYVALPPLFYRLIADKPLSELANWRFIAGTTTATFLAFSLSFAIGLKAAKGDMPQAVMQGVAGAYSNIGYMGPPLILAALGPAASAPVVLIFVFDNILLFSLVPFLMALAGVGKKSLLATTGEVIWRVLTHPFNLATLAGVLASSLRLELPEAIDRMVLWLSQAAAPCALFLLGVTVALRPMKTMPAEVPALVAIKLLLHPLMVWLLLSALGGVPPHWTYAAIIMAALPPALNIFVISTQYGVGVARASACILVGTIVSMITLPGFLWLVKTGRITADLFR